MKDNNLDRYPLFCQICNITKFLTASEEEKILSESRVIYYNGEKTEARIMNITKIVIEDEKSSHIVIAMTLSKAAEATDKIEERCDEVRKMMKGIKIYD